MKRFILLFFFLSSFSFVFGQQADSTDCPKITLEGPSGNKVYEGAQAIFSVKSFKKTYTKTHKISYKWITPNGKILNGQNRSTVYIDTHGLAGEKLVVSVIISGLDQGCKSTETITVDILKDVPVRTETKITTNRN